MQYQRNSIKKTVLIFVIFILMVGLLTSCKSITESEEYVSLLNLYNEEISKNSNLSEKKLELQSKLDKLQEEKDEIDSAFLELQTNFDSLNEDYKIQNEAYMFLMDDFEQKEKDFIELNDSFTALSAEYDDYKEEMKIFEELTKAEAEAKIAAVALQEEQDRIALEKLQEEQAAEEARLKAEEEARIEAEEKIGYNTGITYDQLARTPDEFEGKKVKFAGQVIQTLEEDGFVTIRFAVNNYYQTIILGVYSSDIVSSRVLEDDYIIIYGEAAGLYTYNSTGAGKITIPLIRIDKIDQ